MKKCYMLMSRCPINGSEIIDKIYANSIEEVMKEVKNNPSYLKNCTDNTIYVIPERNSSVIKIQFVD